MFERLHMQEKRRMKQLVLKLPKVAKGITDKTNVSDFKLILVLKNICKLINKCISLFSIFSLFRAVLIGVPSTRATQN